MLYIEVIVDNPDKLRGNKVYTWHIGQVVPEYVKEARVVEFQADGDELDFILSALEKK